MKRRHLILLLGGAGSGAMSVGTGAFSSAEVERGVEVSVVEDERAFVGYDRPNDEGDQTEFENGEEIALVVVENRFAGETGISITDVEVSVTPESGAYPDIENVAAPDGEFIPGETKTITGEVVCRGTPGSAVVEVTVRVEGDGVSAELFGEAKTRRFEIVCQGDSEKTPRVEFSGNNGRAKFFANDDVDSRIWYRTNDQSLKQIDDKTLSSAQGGNIKNQIFDNSEKSGKTVVAVSLKEGIDETYIRANDDLNPGSSTCYEGVPGPKSEFNDENLTPCE